MRRSLAPDGLAMVGDHRDETEHVDPAVDRLTCYRRGPVSGRSRVVSHCGEQRAALPRKADNYERVGIRPVKRPGSEQPTSLEPVVGHIDPRAPYQEHPDKTDKRDHPADGSRSQTSTISALTIATATRCTYAILE